MRTRLLVGLGVLVVLTGACVATGCYAHRESKPAPAAEAGFTRVVRPGSVEITSTYDLSGLSIPQEEIHTLLPRDSIPALTDPARQDSVDAHWLPDNARIVVVRTKREVLGVPLRILNWHEVVNTTVGGVPIAATYCPLCDSAAVFDRRVRTRDIATGESKTVTLEFGVSGALYNSNVLMYDTTDMALWSQLGLRAVSGPHEGTSLRSFPVELIPFASFKAQLPLAQVVSDQTGHQRDYTIDPYQRFFEHDDLLVPLKGVGDALTKKTLGVGVSSSDASWFVPGSVIGEGGYTLTTPEGDVVITMGDAGIVITSAPDGVRTIQSFYYSWSAFNPDGTVVTE